jgi:CdiI immunity protein
MGSQYLKDYPYLDALVGGWFHQDFDIDGSTLEEVLSSYKWRTAPDDRLGAKADIQRFLRNTSDDRLDDEFNERFTPGAFPGRDDLNLSDWLRKIYSLL